MVKHIKSLSVKHMIRFSSVVWYSAIIFLFAVLIYFAFGRSLHLSLWGDDWQLFYIIDKTYGPGNQFPYLSLKGYSQPWGVMNLLLIINKHFFGYTAYGYYLVSMVLRTLSAFAGYLFLSKFTKSKWIGLIGSLFVLVGFTGADTSNYMVHMTTYFVIMFLFLSLYFLIDSYRKFGKFLLACLFYSISLIASPLRSHGLLPFMVVFDILFGITIAKASFKSILVRQIFILVITFIVYKLGFFGSTGLSFINMPVILQMIKEGNYTFISAFVTTLGKAFFPDLYTINVSNVINLFGANWFKGVMVVGFLFEVIIFRLVLKITKRSVKEFFIIICILFLNFSVTALIFGGSFREGKLLTELIFTFLGIFFLTFLIWGLYIIYISTKVKISSAWLGIVMGPVLTLTSLIVPLLFSPGRVLESNQRYLTLSLVGVAITVVSLLKLAIDINKKTYRFLIAFLILLLLVNIKADRTYFSNLLITRNPEISNHIWNQFFSYMPEKYPSKLSLFYFDDSENVGLASDAFLYGFPPRMGLKYNISTTLNIPAYTNIYSEVISTVTDGKAFLRLGYPQKKIGVDQVYAFKITKNGDLLDITQKTRKDLILEINKHK